MISVANQGAVQAVISGIYAASAGVSGKLAFDSESVGIVGKFCRCVVDTATLTAEKYLLLPLPDLDICSSYSVRALFLNQHLK
jgi:hypothetical protein